ncbi:35372_t:CDS:2 [Racocetra persica]|uniref:35372_t:CDS:1 n=1 Tax=Racocetra persica TaxID=160502 RepID=A0ACA9LDV9_9GLOM|nr:35372_t:CDS:2 [Racocetra persica]
MAEIYHSEHKHSIVFKEKIRKLFGEELRIISLEDDFSNDGVLESNVFSKSVLRFLVEMKNEIGTGSCNPTVQATGPWVCILEAVYIEKPIVDLLMDFISLISTNNQAYVERVARLFKALYLGVNRLKEYYVSLDIPTNRQNSYRFFSYLNQYKHQDTIIEFTYEGKLQYNRRTYELCSKIGKVPKLLYINKEMVNGFYMEYKNAIDKLHEENFDWAGKDEIECYLSFMNHKHINWPLGAEDRKKLDQKHDIYWLELLKSKYLGESVDLE